MHPRSRSNLQTIGAQFLASSANSTFTVVNNIRKLDTKGIVLLILILIFFSISMIILYKKFFGVKDLNIKYTIKYFDEGKVCLNNPVVYKNPNLDYTGEGNQFTYSIWLRINDWYSNLNVWKTIFRKGSESRNNFTDWCSYSEQCPGLYLGNKVNNLRTVFTIATKNGLQLETCDIKNVPIKDWFMITLVINHNNLAVYLNAKLVRSCVFPGLIKTNNGPLSINSPVGFNGLLANLEYFNEALEQDDIYKLLQDKPEYDRIDNNYNTNICTGNSFSKDKLDFLNTNLEKTLSNTKDKFKDKL